MIIGVPKEIKDHEFRVALTPEGVRVLAGAGHRVLIEVGAGLGSGFEDEAYRTAGAEVLADKPALFERADLIVKVKEPLPPEYPLFRKGQALFTFLHLAGDRRLTEALLERQVFAIAYETVERPDRSLPLLRPMSEVAGRLAVQEGAFYLGKAHGGRGILLSGVPGVPPGSVVILGAGTVGLNAAKIAVGLGADVSVLDVNLDRLRHVDDLFRGQVVTVVS
ncbi:MAG TPA: alanine dehydrogenase, partial [Nitrospirales bacterium]|nr:alanine dehydrogenase [Nitrospirales bacterium]